MELTYVYWSEYIAFCFVSNGVSLCTIVIADDTVLVSSKPLSLLLLHSYRLCRVPTVKHYGTVRRMCFVGNKV